MRERGGGVGDDEMPPEAKLDWIGEYIYSGETEEWREGRTLVLVVCRRLRAPR